MNTKTIEVRKQLADLKKEIEEQKNSEALKQYIDAMALFHHYSFYNCVLIAFQCPKATHVAGYRTWQKLNRFVKKGEKGIHILAPCFYKKKVEIEALNKPVSLNNADEHLLKQEEMLYFRTVCVFDVSQTEGQELPDWDITTPEQQITLLDRLTDAVKAENIQIEYVENLEAYGTSSGGKICLKKGESPATTFTTLIHEYAHEILHAGQKDLNLTREEREVEAETVVYIVCKHFNIETTAAKYLAVWLQRDDVFKHLERIRLASTKIISKLTDEEVQLEAS